MSYLSGEAKKQGLSRHICRISRGYMRRRMRDLQFSQVTIMNQSQRWIPFMPSRCRLLLQTTTDWLSNWLNGALSTWRLRIMNKRVVMMNIAGWIAAFVEQTDLVIEWWKCQSGRRVFWLTHRINGGRLTTATMWTHASCLFSIIRSSFKGQSSTMTFFERYKVIRQDQDWERERGEDDLQQRATGLVQN